MKQQLPSYSTNTGGIDCYLSQSSGTLSYGQGRRSRIEQVTVLWPDGTRSETPVDTNAAWVTVIDQP